MKLQELNLPRLTNSEYDYVRALARMSSIPLDQCPTCMSVDSEIVEGVRARENGTYKLYDVIYDCDCEMQITLRKHYLNANIGEQYQRLNWDDYRGPDEVKEAVSAYLDSWTYAKLNGVGIQFSSKRMGTGKTFAATYIGRELIKIGEKVYFIPFQDIISVLTRQKNDWELMEKRLYETSVLILDEVIPPTTTPQRDLFHGKFEELIRTRTNFNRITIITTNLLDNELHDIYPRPYSLLAAKQQKIDMGEGRDARQDHIQMENRELLENHEVKPIV